MELYQKISTLVGVFTIIASFIWIAVFNNSNKKDTNLLPIISIFVISAFFDFFFIISSVPEIKSIGYIYLLVFPLSAIIFISFPRHSFWLSLLFIIATVIPIYFIELDTINSFFKPNVIYFQILELIVVFLLTFKMLQGIKNITEINLLYFLVATLFLIDLIATSVLNQIFKFEMSIWLNFMWFLLTYLTSTRLLLIYILFKDVKRRVYDDELPITKYQ